MYLSARDIERMEGTEKVHFLNPNAVRVDKSLGDATGLRSIGVHLVTIQPGFRSAELHVHLYEDECIYILSGHGTAVLGDATVRLSPGDFIGCPARGVAHELINDGVEPLVCLVMGQRLDGDVVDFPRVGKRLYRHGGEWDLVDVGTVERPAQSVLPQAPIPVSMPVPVTGGATRVGEPGASTGAAFRLVPIGDGGRPLEAIPNLPREAANACQASADLYRLVGFVSPWIGYLAMVDGQCVGTCAFKAPPRANRAEIAYFTFPNYEGQGYATAMTRALMNIAFDAHPGILLVAHTPAEENAANAVLKKLGFHLAGRGHDADQGEVWEWTLQTAAS
ncbi:MAG: GNAT family N-acetyltransferase [Burkholderiales bacterium]